MEFELAVIRHGKTHANEEKLYCGWTDIKLSKNGIKEIKKYKSNKIYPIGDVYYTSGMLRTDETLKLIYGNKCDYTKMKHFREMNVGAFDLKSVEDLKNNKAYVSWINDKTGNIKAPNGESKNEFELRIKHGIYTITKDITEKNKQKAVLICHGGVIVKLLEIIFNINNKYYELQPEPGLGYILKHNNTEYYEYSKISEETS